MTKAILNLDDLNYDLYFEFYLLEDFHDRYTYDSEQTEFSLIQLCQAITHYLYLNYNYKKFTGYSFDGTRLTYGLLANIKDQFVMQVPEDNRYVRDFPLDFMDDEPTFVQNLYLNLLLVFEDKIEASVFRKEIYPFVSKIRGRTTNPIWPIFYNDQVGISPSIDSRIRRFNQSLLRIERYRNIDRINQLKMDLANELLKFQQDLEKAISKTLHIYEITLKIIQKDNLNQLKRNQGDDSRCEYLELDMNLIKLNHEMISFCYGDLNDLTNEVIVEFIKYFTLKYFEETRQNINLGLINNHYRNRYNEIMDIKDKIQDSILIQLQELNA